jgi:uncharacterized protein YodC (DUF2158 family)
MMHFPWLWKSSNLPPGDNTMADDAKTLEVCCDNAPFAVGDVVRLNAGDRWLTVESVGEPDEDGCIEVVCVWFSGDDVLRDSFDSDMLEAMDEDEDDC